MRLRELRISLNMKQAEVAKKLGCSPVVYSRYEREERQPDIKTLCALADVFQVSLDEIVGRDTEKTSTDVL